MGGNDKMAGTKAGKIGDKASPLFEEIGKRLGKQPDEVRTTLRDTVEILDCIVEMRKGKCLDGVSTLITVGIRGVARILDQLTQQ